MISGTNVSVIRRVLSYRDEMGEPVFATSIETVGNVLVTPSNTDEMDETNRMFGVTCDFTLHFPKSYTASLEGCSVFLPAPYGDGLPSTTTSTTTTGPVPEQAYRILGDPKPFMPENTPTPWNRAVKVARTDG